jgi:hypothetical protein
MEAERETRTNLDVGSGGGAFDGAGDSMSGEVDATQMGYFQVAQRSPYGVILPTKE